VAERDRLRITQSGGTFEGTIKGSIERGKLADLIVLPEDILTVPDKSVERMRTS
jgi:predicted amidohydrolase YtcJ